MGGDNLVLRTTFNKPFFRYRVYSVTQVQEVEHRSNESSDLVSVSEGSTPSVPGINITVEGHGVLGESSQPDIPTNVCIVDPANCGNMTRGGNQMPSAGGASGAIYQFLNKNASAASIEWNLTKLKQSFADTCEATAKHVQYLSKDKQNVFNVIHTVGPNFNGKEFQESDTQRLAQVYESIFEQFYSKSCTSTTLRLLPVSSNIFQSSDGRPRVNDTAEAIIKVFQAYAENKTISESDMSSKLVQLCIFNGTKVIVRGYEFSINHHLRDTQQNQGPHRMTPMPRSRRVTTSLPKSVLPPTKFQKNQIVWIVQQPRFDWCMYQAQIVQPFQRRGNIWYRVRHVKNDESLPADTDVCNDISEFSEISEKFIFESKDAAILMSAWARKQAWEQEQFIKFRNGT